MSDVRTIRVFIASPGDLAEERMAFKQVLEELNAGFGDGAGVKFEPLGWEDMLASTGRRPQGVINLEIDHCDVFILAMNRRWGQAAPDAKPYSSYTEEEFHRAFNRLQTTKAPEIFVFFKHVDPASIADPGTQFRKVLKFRKSLEKSKQVFHRFFSDEKEFASELDRHLRAYAQDNLPKTEAAPVRMRLAGKYLKAVLTAELASPPLQTSGDNEPFQIEGANAKAQRLALTLAKHAVKSALEGRREEARKAFAQLMQETSELRYLGLAFAFYWEIGDYNAAELSLFHWNASKEADATPEFRVLVLGSLALIAARRGQPGLAKEMSIKAIVTAANLSDKRLIAAIRSLASGAEELGIAIGVVTQARDLFRKLPKTERGTMPERLEIWIKGLSSSMP